MKPENQNPYNSSVVQALKDAIKAAPDGTDTAALDKALKQIQASPQWQKDAETLYKSHSYGNKQHFVRIPLIDNSAARLVLSDTQRRIIELFCGIMSHGYLVQVSMNRLVEFLHASKQTVKNNLDWLTYNGFIAKLPGTGEGGRGGGGAAIYMVNPQICGTGKIENEESERKKFNALAGGLPLLRFNDLQNSQHFIPTYATVPYKKDENTTIKLTVNTLSELADEYKEKALPEGESDSATTGNICNDFPVNTISQLGPKCQPIKNDEPFLDVTFDEDDSKFPF